VPAGARVRLACEIARAREMPGGAMRAVFKIAIEVEGSSKPALTADLGIVYAPTDGRREPA
jgi:acyl dehydratase